MTSSDVKRNIWRNTLSNYICVAVRLLTGVILFRFLYQTLSKEEFGFWALLWSVFGYGILFDFGFGFTAQKRVAELSVHQDWDKLSRVLSTIFFSYLGVAAIFILAGLFGSRAILSVFEITPANRESFEQVLMIFLCGLGIAFPLGLFPEILRGQQRISLANYIFCGGIVVSFILTGLALWAGWRLKALVVIALACTFIPDLICGLFALRRLPQVRLHLKYFSRGMIAETMSFSLYAYLITLSSIILTKTDQLIISSALAVSAVALYQAGAKVAEMFAGLTQQLPDTFSPAAAHLHAKGDRGVLQKLLVDGTRFSVMVATPLYLICAFYMDALLALLTGDPVANQDSYWVAQVLLLWGYTLVLTQSVSKRVFMMCGHEKRLTVLALGEALLNLALSIVLVIYFRNILCVAIGSLISSSIFGWWFLWPWAAREANLTGPQLAKTVLVPTWVACLPLLALIVFARLIPQLHGQTNLLFLLLSSSIAVSVAAIGLWRIALTALERERLSAFVAKQWFRQTNP
jgi:O-antigen/teichoic acid export membrane protein